MDRAPRPCSTPGCPGLVTTRTSRCPDCQRAADKRRGTKIERGYGGAWPRIARQYLATHRTCRFCGQPATTVDHIDGDTTNRNPTNLRALCAPCHRSRTARDQPGGIRLP